MTSRKSADERQNRVTRDLQVVTGGRIATPPPPDGVLAATKNNWKQFWKSDLSAAVSDSDVPALYRLFSLMDERERAYQTLRKGERMVQGSTGQPVLNPLYKLIKQLDEELRQLEDRFGLNPKTRHLLGLTVMDVTKSLKEINRALDQEMEAEDVDPRTIEAKAVR